METVGIIVGLLLMIFAFYQMTFGGADKPDTYTAYKSGYGGGLGGG